MSATGEPAFANAGSPVESPSDSSPMLFRDCYQVVLIAQILVNLKIFPLSQGCSNVECKNIKPQRVSTALAVNLLPHCRRGMNEDRLRSQAPFWSKT
jgi:hypothetical protein